MTAVQHLFVYGTLRRAARHPMHAEVMAHCDPVGPGSVPGRLYDLGPYPALLPPAAATERVRGELYAIRPGAEVPLFAVLDAYEGVNATGSGPPLYRREVVDAMADGGWRGPAWCYCYLGEVSESQRVPSGEYRPG